MQLDFNIDKLVVTDDEGNKKAFLVKDMSSLESALLEYEVKDSGGSFIVGITKTPVATPEAGEVESGTTVELSCETEGAEIYYTTDGTDPTSESTKYTEAIEITSDTTIKAIALKTNYTDSEILTAAYTIAEPVVTKVATPVADPVAGAVTSGTTVALTCSTDGATIYYTTDGSTPSSASTEYTSAIGITEATTIKAIGIKTDLEDSDVLEASYTISE